MAKYRNNGAASARKRIAASGVSAYQNNHRRIEVMALSSASISNGEIIKGGVN
jgi:hypothetical protein